jgi:hypothetical protein
MNHHNEFRKIAERHGVFLSATQSAHPRMSRILVFDEALV